MTSSQIQYIDTTQGVATLAATLSGAPWIAIDTEFLRERTYRPELCLLQIASGGSDKTVACIDPLAVDNIDPLLDVIYEPSVLKVLHAAGQDLEIFYWLRGEVPHNLFDTQVAAPLLGYAEQIGYGNLVSEILKKELSKSHSRADWSRRPLPAKQLQYAADDVIYLSQMYPVMRDRLNKLGRLSWLDQEWLDMTRSEIYEKPAGEVWKRLRHIEKLKGPRLSIAQQLASWRELTARKENLPRNWLMKDETISDLAKQMPDELGELKPNDLQINASILAPRKSLEDLLRGDRDTTVTQGWRGKLVGSALCDVLDGKSGLTFVDGELTLHSQ